MPANPTLTDAERAKLAQDWQAVSETIGGMLATLAPTFEQMAETITVAFAGFAAVLEANQATLTQAAFWQSHRRYLRYLLLHFSRLEKQVKEKSL